MITNTAGIVVILLAIEGLVLYAAGHPHGRKFFSFLPAVFWIYFLPILASTSGLLPSENPVYPFISGNFLPAALILLLLSVDLKSIARLGPAALAMMVAGGLGVVIGAPLTLLLFKPWLPADAWSGFGALSGSWIGGSVNMLAIKEGIGTPDSVFTPMIIVDTVVSYTWMGLLIIAAKFQRRYDKWNKSKTEFIETLDGRFAPADSPAGTGKISPGYLLWLFALALAGSYVSSVVGKNLPEIKNLISPFTWTIILATITGLALSGTRVRAMRRHGSSQLGYALLYFVLTSIGARANLSQIAAVPVYIAAGFVWLLIHLGFLVLVSRLIRAPAFFVAVSSQANVGGTASAPVVAEIYRPGTATVGILMAVLGLILGTFLGLVCSHFCRLVS